MFIFLLSSLVAACAAGVVIISYGHLALQRGWPVGRLFRNTGFQIIFGGLSILGAVIYTVINLSFLWGVGVFIVGWIVAFLISFLLKSRVQMVAIILLVVSLILQFFL